MRTLIAYDGSPGAEQALALAGSLTWPPGTTLHIAAAVDSVLPHYTGVRHERVTPAEFDPLLIEARQDQVSDAVGRLTGGDRHVEGSVLRGRAATVLVERSHSLGADLLIVGSRGHGTVASLLLGSVSAELVDTAPCPVLVARTAEVRGIVVAVDGSQASEAAVSLLVAWPILKGAVMHVVSVADVMDPVEFGLAPAKYRAAAKRHASEVAEQKEQHTTIAEETAARLRDAGHDARATLRTGRAAVEIMSLASEKGADLIVTGSKGRTGLTRVFLGSVARKVLNNAATSVLIVRAR